MSESTFKPPERSSLSFDREQGKIYLFHPKRIKVIRLGEPYPAAYVKTAEEPAWQNQIPCAPFPFLFYKPDPRDLDCEDEALRKFLRRRFDLYSEIVDHVGAQRVQLIEQYDQRAWFLHCLLVHGGDYALQLASSNPALAYLLSVHAVFHPLPCRRYWRSVHSLLRRRRREILGHFGFPKSEAAVRLFAGIAPWSCDNSLFFILRKHLRESPELLRQLSFFPRHNGTSLRLICSKLLRHFDFHALNEIAGQQSPGSEATVRRQILDLMRIRSVLERNGLPQPNFYLRSLRGLDAIHDELTEILNWALNVREQYYGEAPLPDVRRGSVWIENIRRSSDLQREGREQRHCIYSYHESMLQGNCFVARMLLPERLTILYRLQSSHLRGVREPELVDARGLCNASPQGRSLQIIQQWLRGIDFSLHDPNQLTIFDDYVPGELLTQSG